MYNDNNKINSIYFKKKKKNKKKNINLNKYHILVIIIATILFFSFLNVFFNKPKDAEKKIFINKEKSNDLLPPKPKEKWKYIQKLEHL